MTNTLSTAIQTNLGEDNYGTFESGIRQLPRLNDRDIYELLLDDPAVAGSPAPGTAIAFTEVVGDTRPRRNLGASNRAFDQAGNPIAFAAGTPLYTVVPATSAVNSSIYFGISTALNNGFDPNSPLTRPGAGNVFNYTTSIAYIKTALDIDGDGFVRSNERELLIFGNNADNAIVGTGRLNIILGFGGNDDIQGGNGSDEIDGGSGNDTIRGQFGDDIIRGGVGNDVAFGGIGNDDMSGDAGNDLLRGGVGSDTISGGDGNDRLSGEQGDDVLTGGSGNDTVDGGDGFDTLDGGDGNDLLRGLEDDDVLNGGAGADDLRGNGGEDILNGNIGDDVLRGQNGNDTMSGGGGNDVAFGGNGDDFISGEIGNDALRGGSGRDVLLGGVGNDLLSGEADNDILLGGSGNDTLVGGFGSDTYNGYGDGSDTAERDLLIGDKDNITDRFFLTEADEDGAYYNKGGNADFAILRNIQIDAAGVTSGFEDRIFLNAAESYFLANVSFTLLNFGPVRGAGIYIDNRNNTQANDLVAVIENVSAASISGGLGNDLFQSI